MDVIFRFFEIEMSDTTLATKSPQKSENVSVNLTIQRITKVTETRIEIIYKQGFYAYKDIKDEGKLMASTLIPVDHVITW